MLKIDNLKKRYDSFELDCSLQVKPGYITGLIGQNGAGKSTTFKAILGLINFDSGKITIFNKDIKDITILDKQKLGIVLSDSGFSGYLRIIDIIPVLSNLYNKFDKEFFIEQCHRLALPMNKVNMLVASSHDTERLMLDEPTAGLDVMARKEVLEMLREYMEKDDKRAILISSHISSDLENLCDDLYMIDNGKIIFHEDSDVLLSNYALLKVDDKQFNQLDKQYILRYKKEGFGYSCLTNQRQFYMENYPNIVIEKGNIDELIPIMIRGVENEGFNNKRF